MRPEELQNRDDLSAFEHRGETYYSDDKERIYNSDGTLLGYIRRSGIQYAWSALKGDVWGPDGWAEDDTEFTRGSGSWDAAGSHDPAMDAILAAHAKRDAKRDQPSDLMGRLRAWRARHVGYYVLALGGENPDYIGGAFEKQPPYNEAAGFAYLRPPKEIEVYRSSPPFLRPSLPSSGDTGAEHRSAGSSSTTGARPGTDDPRRRGRLSLAFCFGHEQRCGRIVAHLRRVSWLKASAQPL